MVFVRGLALLLIPLLSACAPGNLSSPAPTQTLIPPAATHPAPSPTSEDSSTDSAEADAVLIPAGAHALVRLATQDLATHVSANQSAIRLVGIEAVSWAGDDLGCVTTSSQTPGDGASVRGYRLVLEVDGTQHEYHTDTAERVVRCEAFGAHDGNQPGSDSIEDPIAAELVALARRRLAEDLDLPLRRIRLVAVEPITWPDTSLGCPQPEIEYAPVAIDGYRLVLEAGETEYYFHTDFDRLFPCDEDMPSATEASEG